MFITILEVRGQDVNRVDFFQGLSSWLVDKHIFPLNFNLENIGYNPVMVGYESFQYTSQESVCSSLHQCFPLLPSYSKQLSYICSYIVRTEYTMSKISLLFLVGAHPKVLCSFSWPVSISNPWKCSKDLSGVKYMNKGHSHCGYMKGKYFTSSCIILYIWSNGTQETLWAVLWWGPWLIKASALIIVVYLQSYILF